MSFKGELIKFCSDPGLVELLELCKSSSDIMDLLTPRENQHSDLLAWCFNAREGHSQGDALLKDFLLAVFQRSMDVEPGDRIYGRGLTRDFVRAWTPSRILTSSFATAFCIREYEFPLAAGDLAGKRLDLLIIDPENRILVVVENKAGARFRSGQLSGYVEATQKSLLSKAVFKDFEIAFVAMDRNIDADTAPEDDDQFDPRWARLDYMWLKPGAKRAEMAVQRGNQGAALLMSYCRAQTGYESESEHAISRKARDLAIEYPNVVRELQRVTQDLVEPECWTPSLMRADSEDGQLLRLYMQNRDALDRILDVSPLWLLNGRLEEHYPEYRDAENWDGARVWMAFRLPVDRPIPMRDKTWPLFLRVRQLNLDSGARPKLKISVHWNPHFVPEDDVERVCTAIGRAFPSAAGSASRGKGMTLAEAVVDGVDAAEPQCKKLIAVIQQAFADFV